MTLKQDALRKRLLAAGLSQEACSKYFDTFRAFLNARLTKPRFEVEMLKILPRDKIYIHNEIIQDILLAAQQKREGLPDLPAVTTPTKDRRTIPLRKERPTPSQQKGQAPVKTMEQKPPKVGTKRPYEEADPTPNHHIPDDSSTAQVSKKAKRNAPKGKAADIVDKPKLPKPRALEKSTPALPPPSPSLSGSARVSPKSMPASSTMEIATYDGLPYFPVRPGDAMDVELFLKLRQRMRRIAVEQLGMGGVKDDAVALMVHAMEIHVKRLVGGAARVRVGRDGSRPHRNLQCGAIRGYDVREVVERNGGLLGDERGMDLERLLMLL